MTIPALGLPFYIYSLPILVFAGRLAALIVVCCQQTAYAILSVIFICTLAFLVTALVSCLAATHALTIKCLTGLMSSITSPAWGKFSCLTIALCILWFSKESHLQEQFLRGDVCAIFLITHQWHAGHGVELQLTDYLCRLGNFFPRHVCLDRLHQANASHSRGGDQILRARLVRCGDFACSVLLFSTRRRARLIINTMLAKLPSD